MAKIRLNSAHWTVLTNPVYHIATRELMDILHADLEDFRNSLLIYADRFRKVLPEGTDVHSGRITRGMNHNRCPYVVLDYPRLVTNGDFLFFRIVFWFGHNFNFSVIGSSEFKDVFKKLQLHLSGEWLATVGHPYVWSNRPEDFKSFKEINDYKGQEWKIAKFFEYTEFPRWKKLVHDSLMQIIDAL